MRLRLTAAVAACALAASVPGCNCGRGPGVVTNTPVVHLEASVLDFGPVQELTSKQGGLSVSNLGRAPLHVTATLEAGGSPDFTLDTTSLEVPASGQADLLATFAPLGNGSDEATVLLSTDDPDQPAVRATLRGGPIAPALAFDPDPLDFRPTSQPLVTRPAALKNVGLSTLTVNAVGVDVSGNPDFSVTPPALPLSLRPGETRAVDIAYARSPRAEDGRLEVHSDDADAAVRYLSLLPDPPAACIDGLDNDSDGLTDFPDDPGCLDVADQDEMNPPQCINGASQPCGTSVGLCRPGVRVCANSLWGGCDGGVRPATESCNGTDDDCNGFSDDGISEVCAVFGCSGARACLADAGVDGGQWTPCFPVGAVPEQCDGLDNDCNGQADEGVVRACTAFSCAGLQVCIPDAGGAFTACVATNPLAETCNGADDDCDGVADDGLMDLVCGVGQCRRTAAACVNGDAGSCTPGTPSTEVCNGADDDCNGINDDGLSALSCGVGQCRRTVAACVLGDAGVCTPGAPVAETCNTFDDDCNGTADDGLGTLSCGVGQCARTVAACLGGAAGTCIPGTPVSEACNRLDDDCNGTLDDNIPDLMCGVGQCRRTAAACVNGDAGTCTPGAPAAEACNNLDDDCNGVTDSFTRACYSGPPATRSIGRCAEGTQTCTTGSWTVPCAGEVLPTTEACNNLDDDCNGTTDSFTRACYSGPPATRGIGRCADGTQTCTTGSWTVPCAGEVLPAAENCANSLDDDCDGTVNDGCSGCNPNGLYTLDAGTISYGCCLGLVNLNINQFQFLSNGATVTPGPTGPGNLSGAATTCPSGSFNNVISIPGGCTETYRLTGSFVGPNTWVGTFTATFTGSQCGCFGVDSCTNQTWNISAGR